MRNQEDLIFKWLLVWGFREARWRIYFAIPSAAEFGRNIPSGRSYIRQQLYQIKKGWIVQNVSHWEELKKKVVILQ